MSHRGKGDEFRRSQFLGHFRRLENCHQNQDRFPLRRVDGQDDTAEFVAHAATPVLDRDHPGHVPRLYAVRSRLAEPSSDLAASRAMANAARIMKTAVMFRNIVDAKMLALWS